MKNFKKDFPIFTNNPGLVYLDNAASAQKPGFVIDSMKYFMEHDYANIHRGAYSLSERSEEFYEDSKRKVAEFIGASSWQEISYTYNSTYAFNLLTSSFKKSGILKKGDKVLLSIVEHHANIVPWLILKDEIGIEVDFININNDYSLDLEDLKNKLDEKVKVVSLTYVSNVTGQIFDLDVVSKIIRDYSFVISSETRNLITEKIPYNNEDLIGIDLSTSSRGQDVEDLNDIFRSTAEGQKEGELQNEYNGQNEIEGKKILFIVDASQAMPHFRVDVKKLDCDFMIFTGHKIMADTGIGILYGKKELLKKLTPAWGGGGAINWVRKEEFSPSGLPFRFEPGTPHIVGAVSLLKSLEYIEQIGGYDVIEQQEKELVKYFLDKLEKFKGKIKLIGSEIEENRVGVFTFHIVGVNSNDIAEKFALENICIRAGHHCTEPLMENCSLKSTFRASLYFYNDFEDIDKFFEVLEKITSKA